MKFNTSAPVKNLTEQTKYEAVDKFLIDLAIKYKAKELFFPSLISSQVIELAEYDKAFPHLLHAVGVVEDCTNLKSQEKVLIKENICLSPWCLSPAVCYHIFAYHSNRQIIEPTIITSRGICFRNEAEFLDGRRQREFGMREIVLIGKEKWVMEILMNITNDISILFENHLVNGRWEDANDPFFLPIAEGKATMQKLLGTKQEFQLSKCNLAVASTNFHGKFFGERFEIKVENEISSSACIAFGIDRLANIDIKFGA